MEKQPSTPMPEEFGRYHIVKLLGKGGMGSVYLARDTQLDREVALKIPQFSGEGRAGMLERFRQEARAAATLHHPNICPVYEVGEIDGTHYLAMAYIHGKPLSELILAGKTWTVRQIVALVRKLALALAETHKRGVIHRDLKPGNVMIDVRGEPIIMDFGLARRTSSGDPRLTQLGSYIGSPAYMSPEQMRGDVEALGPGCDIYGLGVILYEALTRELPFTGDSVTLVARILSEPPPAPSALRPDVDAALDAICRKAMAKRVGDRFSSMAEFASVLHDYLRDPNQTSNSVSARQTPKPGPSVVTQQAPREDDGIRDGDRGGRRSKAQVTQIAPNSLEEPQAKSGVKRRRRRKRARERPVWPWIAGGSAAAGVLVLLIFLLIPRGPRLNPERTDLAPRPFSKDRNAPSPIDPAGPEPGWQPLFNGRDLTGWRLDGGAPGDWRVDKNELVFAVKNQRRRGWLLTEHDYANFRLRFDFLLSSGANSGVALRTTPKAAKRLVVNIEDDTSPQGAKAQPTERTGALLDLAIDSQAQLHRVGEWNRMEIELRGVSLQVKVNGKPTVRLLPLDSERATKYLGGRLPLKGHIGLKHHSGSVRFKNIQLQELPAAKDKGKPANPDKGKSAGKDKGKPAAGTDKGKPAAGTDKGKIVVKEAAPPITPGLGAKVKRMDDLMLKYRQRIGCTAASLAITQNGRPLYVRGYGWSDKEKTVPTRPDTLIGIASCDAPLIAASVRVLARTGKLGKSVLKAPLFDLLKIKPRGQGVPDDRVRTITVQHFLDQAAGWDQGSFDQALKAARAEGFMDPISQEVVLGFLMTQPLKHPPGTNQQGACYPYVEALRYLVEKCSGRRSLEFVRSDVLRPLGIQAVLAPDSPESKVVPTVWNLADGGPVCASAGALCQFMTVFDRNGERRKAGASGATWGSLEGCTSLMLWLPDGTSAVLLFNGRGSVSNQEIETEFEKELVRVRQGAP
jgi:serine/threonine protein kinase/CubicO group peptidase (beta-lactamase class C family)